jgi:hypothetical protein
MKESEKKAPDLEQLRSQLMSPPDSRRLKNLPLKELEKLLICSRTSRMRKNFAQGCLRDIFFAEVRDDSQKFQRGLHENSY